MPTLLQNQFKGTETLPYPQSGQRDRVRVCVCVCVCVCLCVCLCDVGESPILPALGSSMRPHYPVSLVCVCVCVWVCVCVSV